MSATEGGRLPCPAALNLGPDRDGKAVYMGCMMQAGHDGQGDEHLVIEELPAVFGPLSIETVRVEIRWTWPPAVKLPPDSA